MTNKDIKNAYAGTTQVKAMYLGSTKVYPVETLSRPQIGDFVYSDKTWSTELDGTKTCIGVIVIVRDNTFDFCALEVSLGTIRWGNNSLISGITTTEDMSTAMADFEGKSNTVLNTEYGKAGHYCNKYSTEGFIASTWFLPALGQLVSYYINREIIDQNIEKAGGETIKTDGSIGYWSSTQATATNAWRILWDDKMNIYASTKNTFMYARAFSTCDYSL